MGDPTMVDVSILVRASCPPSRVSVDRSEAVDRLSTRWRAVRPLGTTTEDPVGGPGCRPAEGEISPWQEHEAGTREFTGGGVVRRIPKQDSSVRRIAQVAHQADSIVSSAPSDVVQGLGAGSGDDHAPGLGQRREAGNAGKPAQ